MKFKRSMKKDKLILAAEGCFETFAQSTERNFVKNSLSMRKDRVAKGECIHHLRRGLIFGVLRSAGSDLVCQ